MRTSLIKPTLLQTKYKECLQLLNHNILILFKFSSNLSGQSSNVAVVLCRVHSHSILLLKSSFIHTHSIKADLDIIIM